MEEHIQALPNSRRDIVSLCPRIGNDADIKRDKDVIRFANFDNRGEKFVLIHVGQYFLYRLFADTKVLGPGHFDFSTECGNDEQLHGAWIG